ncbi:hypothetical protein SD77_2091 [Bacillus badius]|uniref:Uncharacterized protein n=1 Tax=Bacillus badius TaxID=1455 RepID=A0ABR5AY26_BACBA|nr:hypothetical protein SD78_2444 [Bacillus badius]KIL79637.1 hypothetical protein SD77_2091 [Bacillus badius]
MFSLQAGAWLARKRGIKKMKQKILQAGLEGFFVERNGH